MYLLSPYYPSYNSKVLLYLSHRSKILQILTRCSTFYILYLTWHWASLLYCPNVFNYAYFYTSWYKMFLYLNILWRDSYFYISYTELNLNLSGKYISLLIRNTQIWCWSKCCWYLSYYYLIFMKIKHIEYTIISIIGSRTRVLRMIIYFICNNTHMFSPPYRLGYYAIPFLTIFLFLIVAITLISQHITDIISGNGQSLQHKKRRTSTLIDEPDSNPITSDHHFPYQVRSIFVLHLFILY